MFGEDGDHFLVSELPEILVGGADRNEWLWTGEANNRVGDRS